MEEICLKNVASRCSSNLKLLKSGLSIYIPYIWALQERYPLSNEHLEFFWRHVYFDLETEKLNTLNIGAFLKMDLTNMVICLTSTVA